MLMSDEIIYADGFEDALLGTGVQFNKDLAVYDYRKCLDILIERDGMSHEEAVEWMDFNVIGAYVGENTPVFLMTEVLQDFIRVDLIRQDHQSYHQPELLLDEHQRQTISDTPPVHSMQTEEGNKGE